MVSVHSAFARSNGSGHSEEGSGGTGEKSKRWKDNVTHVYVLDLAFSFCAFLETVVAVFPSETRLKKKKLEFGIRLGEGGQSS